MKNKISKLVSTLSVGALLFTFSCKKPSASFTSDKATAKVGETVTFTNSSIADAKAMWDFGDGTQSASNQNSITHVYAKAGTYNVTLSAAKKNGKKVSDAPAQVITITEDKNPKALFTSKTVVAAGEIVTFNSTSTDADMLAWDFGDGSITTANPVQTKVYSQSGTYVVTLAAFAKNSTLRNVYSNTITVYGGNGDNMVQSMLLGQWRMASHSFVNNIDGAPYGVATCSLMNTFAFTPYSVTSFSTGARIEIRTGGQIVSFDSGGNVRGNGNYSIKDATKLNSWSHTKLFNDNGTDSVNSAVSTPFTGNSWTITVLNATTLTLTYSYSNPISGLNPCVAGTRPQVVTETVTYIRS